MRPVSTQRASAPSCFALQTRRKARTNAMAALTTTLTTTTTLMQSSLSRRDPAAPLGASTRTTAWSPPRSRHERSSSSVSRRATSSENAGSDSNAGDNDNLDDNLDARNSALLSQLLSALDAGGASAVASLTARGGPWAEARSLKFMQWLSDRDQEEGEEEGNFSPSSSSSSSSSPPASSSPLSRLGEVLTILREGLHAAAFEELQEALASAIAAAAEKEEDGEEGGGGTTTEERMRLLAEQAFPSRPSGDGSEHEEEEAINALVAQRWSALAAARSSGGKGGLAKRGAGNSSSSSLAAAALSLSPQALVAAQRRASDLSAEVTLQRARSAMELMGRVRIEKGGGGGRSGSGGEGGEEGREGKEAREEELDDEQALSLLLSSSPSPSSYENLSPLPAEAAVAAALAGDPAPRILALLLEEPDPEARAALLADAFDSGDGGGVGAEEEGMEEQEVDFVFTTPLKLVQAIDLELGRLERAAARSSSGGGEENKVEVEGKFAPPPLFLPGKGPAAAPAGGEELVAVLEDLRQRALEFV